jgi:hypothetical protein
MKKIYFLLFVLSAAVSAMAVPRDNSELFSQRKLCRQAVAGNSQHVSASRPAASERMVITNLEGQVQGRYSCVYYSPLIWDVTGEPFGWCVEQPMIVEDYFGVEEGDVNIGYLFLRNAILKGHVDMDAGTITIPSRKAITYYEDPDDYDDPGRPVYFVTVDVEDRKYVPNYDRPFVGSFELHDGRITKITTDDRWGYVVCNKDGSIYGWFEIAENTTLYLGHGEMEYVVGNEPVATVIHAVSDGKKATVYNAFNTGWDNPVTMDLDDASKRATVSDQSVSVGGKTVVLADKSCATVFSGIIRDVDWDIDKRDPSTNSVLDFGDMTVYDKAADKVVASYGDVRFYFKEDVFEDRTSGIESVVSDTDNTSSSEVILYDLSGMKVDAEKAAPGIYIRRQGSDVSKVMIR